MTPSIFPAFIAFALAITLSPPASAAPPTPHERVLPNGVRVCYLHYPNAKGVSIFTFLPMGLAADDAGRTQWAHLIEHLVIRTTVEGQLSNVNAETLPDHLRLDYYGTPADWREGLSHHARWLEGLPFTEASLRDEPGRANAEIDYTAKVFATHKFATAAWNQVYRHGRDDVALKGDLVTAAADDLRRYRDGRLFVPKRTLVCVIGADKPDAVLDAVAEALGGIKPAAEVGEPEPPAKLAPGDRRATWDVDARHVVFTWPIVSPEEDPAKFVALAAAAKLLFTDAAAALLGQQGRNPLVGVDLRTPEASHLYLSAAMTPRSDPAAARQTLARSTAGLRDVPPDALRFSFAKAQLLNEIEMYDPAAIRRRTPAQVSDGLVEAQAALTWATAEYRLGAAKAAYKAAVQVLTPQQVQQAAARFLTDDRLTLVELHPRAPR